MPVAAIVTLAVCLIPLFIGSLLIAMGDDPKSWKVNLYAAMLVYAPLLIAAVVVTTLGGLTVLRALEYPGRVQVAYVAALGTFWVACVFKNVRDLRQLTAAFSPKKDAGLADDRFE